MSILLSTDAQIRKSSRQIGLGTRVLRALGRTEKGRHGDRQEDAEHDDDNDQLYERKCLPGRERDDALVHIVNVVLSPNVHYFLAYAEDE